MKWIDKFAETREEIQRDINADFQMGEWAIESASIVWAKIQEISKIITR